jgi:23S rRNA (cytidine1920-2'-O)/16S rRNA (cytidine1409-2'-O)-methyltransferase
MAHRGAVKVIKKERIDKLLVRKGIVDSRERAQALIDRGAVRVGGRQILKGSTQVLSSVTPQLEEDKVIPYVSRGGLKLEAALKAFGIDPSNKQVMDVGSSTGGFADCLLQKGATRIYAVDVGYGQLAWRLRRDPRVVCMERTNIRYLDPRSLEGPVDLVTIDVSFISLKKVLHKVLEMLKPGGSVLALVKPQFEVGKGEVGRGGVVRERFRHERVIEEIISYARSIGFIPYGHVASPLPGKKGNVEYFLHLKT